MIIHDDIYEWQPAETLPKNHNGIYIKKIVVETGEILQWWPEDIRKWFRKNG